MATIFPQKPLLDIFLENENQIKDTFPKVNNPLLKDNNTKIPTNVIGQRLNAIKDDTTRIFNFMKSPKGLIWIAKQTGLQLTNPKNEILGALDQKRLFNPVKLFSNIPGKAIGLHVERHGYTSDGDYENIAKKKNNLTDNRIIKIYNELGYGNLSKSSTISSLNDLTINNINDKISDKLSKLTGTVKNKIDTLSSKYEKVGNFVGRLLTYDDKIIKTISGIGGPNSMFGVGVTNIKMSQWGNPINYHSNDKFLVKYNNENQYNPNTTGESNLKNFANALYNNANDPIQPGQSNVQGGNTVSDKKMKESILNIQNKNKVPQDIKIDNPFQKDINNIISKDDPTIMEQNTYQSINDYNKNKWKTYDSDKNVFYTSDNTFEQSYAGRIKKNQYEHKYKSGESYYSNWNYFKRLNIPEAGIGNYDAINAGRNVMLFVYRLK